MPLGSIPSTANNNNNNNNNIFLKKGLWSQVWWRTLVIPVLGRLRQEDPGSWPASAT